MSFTGPPDESDHHSVGLVIAAVLSWVPPISVLIAWLTAHNLPAEVPTHWAGNGKIDGWSSITGDLWTTIPAGFAGSVLVTLIVIFGGNNIPRIKGSLGLAGIVLLSSGVSFTWFVSVATARDSNLAGQSFGLLALSAFILAGLVFAAGALPRRNADTPDQRAAPRAEDAR